MALIVRDIEAVHNPHTPTTKTAAQWRLFNHSKAPLLLLLLLHPIKVEARSKVDVVIGAVVV
jgi:hypothetical protein